MIVPPSASVALRRAKYAGYHDDTQELVRVMVESRVRGTRLQDAWMEGKRARAAGVPCGCMHCTQGAGA